MSLGGDYQDGPPRPGIGGYVVALVLALGSCVTGVAWGWIGVGSAADRFQSFAAPGSATVTLDEAGTWKLYAERTGRSVRRTDFDACTVTVTAADGRAVPVATFTGGTETYNVGNKRGVAIRQIDVPQPGDYTVDVQWNAGTKGEPFTAALNTGFMGSIMVGVFGGCGVAVLGVLLGAIVAIVTLVRRTRRARPAV